jgi:hypothetical protein
MAHFEATVRLFEIEEADAPAARHAIEERLRTSGFSRMQIVHVGLQRSWTPPVRVSRRRGQVQNIDAGPAWSGGLMIAVMVAWALWFVWWLVG